jgi:mersacidin/lichenicidin family type 2 lantibiotic
MSPLDIIRAWKDEEYRLSLSDAERALLPEHPAGGIDLADGELHNAVGALGGKPWTTDPYISVCSKPTKFYSDCCPTTTLRTCFCRPVR